MLKSPSSPSRFILLSLSCWFLFQTATIHPASAADTATKKTFLKFHQNLFQSCQEEKIECSAFPLKSPEHLKAEQSVLLAQMVKPSDEHAQLSQAVQDKVLASVPEVNQAYQVLSQEYVHEMPKTHDQAIRWIIQNSKALSEGLQKAKAYDENQAYSFAKISVLMRFVYESFHLGTVTQADLDAKYEFEKAGHEISNKLAALAVSK
jgi:hypothetical protein